MPNDTATLREDLEGAIQQVEPEDSTLRGPEQEGGTEKSPNGEANKPLEGSASDKPASPAATSPTTPDQPGVTQKATEGQAKPQEGQAKPQEGAQGQELKPPSQWKPQVREKWNQLPREVQEEVLRREADNLRLVGSVGQKIKFADEVSQHLQPFADRLIENNVPPQAFVADVFTTVKTLSQGTPEEKAAVLANIIQSYGIDVRVLDSVLSARLSAPPPSPELMRARHEAAEARAQLAMQNQVVNQGIRGKVTETLENFANDPKNEFFYDVKDMMADLMAAGRASTLEDAYQACIWAHPDTRKILLQREAQSRATSRSQRAAAARSASSAIHGSPLHSNAANVNPNASLREDLEQAFDDHST